MGEYYGSRAQESVAFPLSGPPVCVSLFGYSAQRGCLRSVHDEESGDSFIELRDIEHGARTPAERFYLEPSKQHEGLLHVRCCDGNKYWVARQQRTPDGGSAWFISATADEPEEDLTKPSCTLFDFQVASDSKRPSEGGGGYIRCFHSQQNKYVGWVSVSGDLCFIPGNKAYLQLGVRDLLSVHRLSQQKELPKYVAFKGNNGKYLTEMNRNSFSGKTGGDDWVQQFSSSDLTDPDVIHETFTDDYGIVRIRNNTSGRFWTCGVRSLLNGTIGTINDSGFYFGAFIPHDAIYSDVNTLFKVVSKDGNIIALQNLGNGKFCESVTDPTIIYSNILVASGTDINSSGVMLQIEEPVMSREIYDVEYNVGGKKTSSNQNVSRTEVLSNNRTHETHQGKPTIELYDRTESKWDANLTLDAGIKAHISASLPFIMEGGAESHLDFHGEYNWGETKIQETKRMYEYSYPVPPMTKVLCSIFTREDVVDVPFSYKQKDVMYSGNIVIRQLHDGIYHGTKSSDIDIDITEESIA
ncbi:unnamed protein product [Triticum turgidum subsp. durum]|uniref:Agglutinin domain-containing protein n=1 Tax=Triticum turgidum subsp. durum TaxID=4567 RepID=A0A9R1PCX3_TRITD|nr:unnamed protein product [Triticum turgidum subsp. durum]